MQIRIDQNNIGAFLIAAGIFATSVPDLISSGGYSGLTVSSLFIGVTLLAGHGSCRNKSNRFLPFGR